MIVILHVMRSCQQPLDGTSSCQGTAFQSSPSCRYSTVTGSVVAAPCTRALIITLAYESVAAVALTCL